MYSTCLYCNDSLGANEVVETFPVGRRLAFDQAKGRLWVVCRKCEKWNLTPLEERWEAIESCERLFRDTRKRVSTDNIGLARLSEGLELVRIGEPQRPEFAAWRYGDQFGRRRRKEVVLVSTVGAFAVAAFVANIHSMVAGASALGGVLGGLNGIASWTQLGRRAYRNRRVLGEVESPEGKWVVKGRFAAFLRLVPTETGEGWGIEIPCEAGEVRRRVVLQGSEARRLAARVVPSLTPGGGSKQNVQDAVRQIDQHGDADQYLRWLARNAKVVRDWWRPRDALTGKRLPPGEPVATLAIQGIDACLAVEMAVNEENERRALETELALLEEAWKEAEEIAGIADRLTVPADVERRLIELKSRKG